MIPYELQIVFCISVKNEMEILLGIVLNLQMAFGRMEDELRTPLTPPQPAPRRAWSLDMAWEG